MEGGGQSCHGDKEFTEMATGEAGERTSKGLEGVLDYIDYIDIYGSLLGPMSGQRKRGKDVVI